MKTYAALITACLITLLTFPAWAQTTPKSGEATGKTSQDEVEYKARTSYDFEKDDINAAIIKPDGDNHHVNTHKKTKSLLKVRMNFVPEIIITVEDI